MKVWLAEVDYIYEQNELLAVCATEDQAKAVCVENAHEQPLEWEPANALYASETQTAMSDTGKSYIVFPMAVVGL